MFRDVGDHCPNCYCDPEKTYCGVRRRIFLKVILGFGTMSFIVMGILMVMHFARNSVYDLGTIEAGLFTCMLFTFLVCYIIVIIMETSMYLELLWSIICGSYEHLCDGLYYIRDHVRLPSRQDILVLFSARGAMARAPPQQEVSASESESDEERPPLPPKSRKVTEAAGGITFQKLTSDVSQGASSSTAPADGSEGSSSSLLHRPHCSTQSAPSLESSGRRGKKLSKRELFKNLMLEVSNLNPIHEENLDQQEATGIKVPLSLLTQNSASGDETEIETSFTTEPQQTESAEQERAFDIDEKYEHALSQGISGRQAQARALGARKKQKGCEPTPASVKQISGKEQWSGIKDFERKSPEKPSLSNYVPFSELKIPAKASENEGVEKTKSSKVRFSGPQSVQRASHIESSEVQTSTSYVSLPQLENQSREFGIRIEKQSSQKQQTSSYVPLSSLENPAKEQTSRSGLFCSQEQERASNIKYQENQSQASASYVGLSELENQSSKFGTKTQDMQSSPEMSSRYVRFSTLDSQAQEQTSSTVSPGSQGHVWVSSILHQSLASFIEIPKEERQSIEHDTRVREGIQRNPEQQPVSRNIQFSPSVSQSQEQTSEAGFLSFDTNEQSPDVQSSQGGQDQSAASYVGLPELEKQSREFSIRTVKEQYSPEKQSASSYVSISPGFQVSGMQSTQRMQTNIGQTSATGASDLMRQARTSDIQRRRSSRKQSPPYYTRLSESEKESREKKCLQNPCTSSYVGFPISKNQFQRTAISETEHSSQAIALQAPPSQSEISTPQRESVASDIVDKLKNLQQASIVGFPKAASQTRNFGKDQELTSSANYAERMAAEKSGSCVLQKRRGSLSIGPERPIRGSGSRTKKGTGGSAERSGYAPYPVLLRSGRTPSPEPVVIASFQRKESSEGQIRQRSSTDSLCLEETDKYETQKKETILSLSLATGGLVLSKEGTEEDETETDSSGMSFMYDQPMDILDLSHIEVPLPPPTDEEVTKEHRKK